MLKEEPEDAVGRREVLEGGDGEGDEGAKHIDEYSNFKTERGQRLREELCKRLHLASIEFQSLEGIIEAIGLEPCKLCTYCWNGKE